MPISSTLRRPHWRAHRLLTTLATAVFSLAASVGAVFAETPAAYMQRVANELMAAARTGSSSSMAAVIRAHADVPSIGLTALGSYRERLPQSDRPAYYNGMINFIARYGAKEAPKYPVGKAVMVGQSAANSVTSYVDSRVTLRDGATYDVRWVINRRGGTYKVRDAEVIGFRMTSFLDTMFQNYIGENGGNPKALVIALNR
ncbi:MAG: ABC transporter substrate-binding protein [Hyphomicrobium sp.]